MKNITLRVECNGTLTARVNPRLANADERVRSLIGKHFERLYDSCVKRGSDISEADTAAGKTDTAPGTTAAEKFADGTAHDIFGDKLTIRHCSDLDAAYRVEGNVLLLRVDGGVTPDSTAGRYISAKAREVFGGLAEKYFDKLGIPPAERPRIALDSFRSKWGHCHKGKNEIRFNIQMYRLPLRLLEYVVAHEVAHLKVMNHGSLFYAVGEKLLPGFRGLDRELNKVAVSL